MKKNTAILGIILSLVLIISFYFDAKIISIFISIKNNSLDKFFMVMTYISSKIIVAGFLTTLFLIRKHRRKWLIPLWITIATAAVVSFLTKIIFQRPRPYQTGIIAAPQALQELSHFIWDFSFASSHAMLAFCAIPILSRHYPKFKYLWIVFGVFVALSRVYFGMHYMSDVIAGAIIGYLIGYLILHLEEKHNFSEKIFRMILRK